MRRRRLLAILLVAAGLLANLPMASVADAHANLLASSPAEGQSVGGSVELVQLIFDEPISELTVTISDPNGDLIDPSIETITGQQYHLGFDPLTVEGAYTVRYEFLSIDTDVVELLLRFDYDSTAPAALPISGPVIVDRPASDALQWVPVGLVGAVVVLLAWLLWRRRRALAQLRA